MFGRSVVVFGNYVTNTYGSGKSGRNTNTICWSWVTLCFIYFFVRIFFYFLQEQKPNSENSVYAAFAASHVVSNCESNSNEVAVIEASQHLRILFVCFV